MKKILLIAGPTCVFIDPVRVLTNVSSGRLGYELFSLLCPDFVVSLLVSSISCMPWPDDAMRFYTADELFSLINDISHYDLIINAAAISDFDVKERSEDKISSHQQVNIQLIPREKLWPKLLPKTEGLILFKLEKDIVSAEKEARQLLEKSDKIRFVVANAIVDGDYQGIIVKRMGNSNIIYGREPMARAIVREIEDLFGRMT